MRAAVLQERLTEQAVATACGRRHRPGDPLGRAGSRAMPSFRALAARIAVALKRQPDGDLGARMLAAIAGGGGPTLVIGTDCPALTAAHLRDAAAALREADVVLIPAEDGGYVLIGTRAPQPALFAAMAWSTDTVLAETRAAWRARPDCARTAALWDVDTERSRPHGADGADARAFTPC